MSSHDSLTAPRYRLGHSRLLQAGWYIVRNRPRNIGQDYGFLTGSLPAAPLVGGAQNLPRAGPFVLVANHYERPGLWMGWSGMALARAVFEHTGRRLRIIAIAEWSDYRLGGISVPPAVTRWIFGRFFRVYGFIPMEPASAGPKRRADSVRRVVKAVQSGEAILLFPEGDIGETAAMIEAQPGTGTFLIALAARGAAVIPCGVFETGGALRLQIGSPVSLSAAGAYHKAGRDMAAIDTVMRSTSALVPEEIRGVYSYRSCDRSIPAGMGERRVTQDGAET